MTAAAVPATVDAFEGFVRSQAAVLAEHFGDERALCSWAAAPDRDASAPAGWSDEHSRFTAKLAVQSAAVLLRGEPR